MDEELAFGKYPRTETSLVLPLVVHCLRQQEHEGHFCGGQEFPVTMRYKGIKGCKFPLYYLNIEKKFAWIGRLRNILILMTKDK